MRIDCLIKDGIARLTNILMRYWSVESDQSVDAYRRQEEELVKISTVYRNRAVRLRSSTDKPFEKIRFHHDDVEVFFWSGNMAIVIWPNLDAVTFDARGTAVSAYLRSHWPDIEQRRPGCVVVASVGRR